MKAVVDTNVFISGIFWKGNPHEIIRLAEERTFEICATEETLKEILSVLARDKFRRLFNEAETNYPNIAGKVSSLVTLYPTISIRRIIGRDPKDAIFLCCALSAQADFIISGDKDLLALEKFQEVEIVTPKIFLAELKRRK